VKVLALSDLWLPFPGGAERLMFNLSRELLRAGHDVRVLTGYEYPQEFDGPPVASRPIGVFDDRDSGAAIVCNVLDKFKPDVVITHHLYAFQFEPEIVRSGVPFVQLVLNTRRLDSAAMAVYISRFVAHSTDDMRRGDMIITPPAYDDVIAETHGDAIGFIKPIEHKGVELVYDIARRMPDRQFVILRGEWQTLELIEQLPNITFLEPVDDIRDFYRLCRIVLMPSISEDAGTVAQECALNRIPCVSSNVGGLHETNAGGIRIAQREPDRWVRAIMSLDRPQRYEHIVQLQTAHLTNTHQEARMSEFVARIERLTQ
jgi:glycosyltransferase involved in cell wall biosynthesis